MERLILSWPVKFGSHLSISKTEDWPLVWTTDGAGLVRQVGRFGNAMFSKAQVFQGQLPAKGVQIIAGASLSEVFQVSNGKAFNQVVCILEISGGEKVVDALRRPGRADIASAAKSALGVVLEPAETSLATAVYFTDSSTEQVSNGMLRLPKEANTFRSDITYSLVVSAVAAERLILEAATLANFKSGLFGHRAYRYSGLLQNWLTIPSTDSSKLLRHVEELRKSQGLDQRHNQVRLALEQQVKATNFAGAAFVATLGLTSSLIPTFQSLNQTPRLGTVAISLLLCLVPTSVALLTWFLAKRA